MIVLLLEGPNLNLLGVREPGIYGKKSAKEIHYDLEEFAKKHGVEMRFFQSNHEGVLIDHIHSLIVEPSVDGIILNPGALTHTSIALRDAILSLSIPFVEVHLSNIYRRESFRHISYFSDLALGVIVGLGPLGYRLALLALLEHFRGKKQG